MTTETRTISRMLWITVASWCAAVGPAQGSITITSTTAGVQDWTGFGVAIDPDYQLTAAVAQAPPVDAIGSPLKLRHTPSGAELYQPPAPGTSPASVSALDQRAITNTLSRLDLGAGRFVARTAKQSVVGHPTLWGAMERDRAFQTQITNPAGTVLTESYSYAALDSHVRPEGFEVTGRVSALHVSIPKRVGDTTAMASGKALFTIEYTFDETAAFSFDVSVAAVREATMWVRVEDAVTGERLMHVPVPRLDRQRVVSVEGIIDPGVYRFTALASTISKRTRGDLLSAGGFGQFQVAFAASAIGPDIQTLAATPIPEPATATLIVLLLTAVRRRRRRIGA